MLNIGTIKKDFPIFQHQPQLVYLDSAATSLKPKPVIDKLVEYYRKYSANIFRGIYRLSEKATEEYETTRKMVARFINAKSEQEIVFTRNTTEAINLISYSLGRQLVGKGDEIVVSIMEHHSNFVPWQILASQVGAKFKVVDITDDGYLNFNFKKVANNQPKKYSLEEAISKKTKILALTYASNVLGTINPIKEIIKAARKINPGLVVVIDAAQAAPHLKIDVDDLGGDFLAFSSHKMLGPTGVGILWGKRDLLDQSFPFNFGGEMIQEVFLDKTIFKPPPLKFEAGTPAIGEIIAFKEAVNYLKNLGMEKVRNHELGLIKYTIRRLSEEFKAKINILGPQEENNRGGVISFTFKKYHPHDIAQILDENNIAIRAGHHCAMPLHQRLAINASSRISFYIYNNEDDVEKLISGLKKVEKILG